MQSRWGTGKEARWGDSAGAGALVQPNTPQGPRCASRERDPHWHLLKCQEIPQSPGHTPSLNRKKPLVWIQGKANRSCVRAAGWPTPLPEVPLSPPPRQLRVSLLRKLSAAAETSCGARLLLGAPSDAQVGRWEQLLEALWQLWTKPCCLGHTPYHLFANELGHGSFRSF